MKGEVELSAEGKLVDAYIIIEGADDDGGDTKLVLGGCTAEQVNDAHTELQTAADWLKERRDEFDVEVESEE